MEKDISDGTDISMSEIEHQVRETAMACGKEALSKILSGIPECTPVCPVCGERMRNIGKRPKRIVTLLGEVEYTRNYYACECPDVHSIPKDDRLEVRGTGFTPGVKRVTAKVAASDSFADTSSALQELCGIYVSAKDCERVAKNCGGDIMAKRQQEIVDSHEDHDLHGSTEPIRKLYIEYDGTGVPIRKSELAGVKGKQPGGNAKTREMKTGCIFTQSGTDNDGNPVRDKDSTTYFSRIGTADEFGPLLYSEAAKRGIDRAETVVIIGDGAKWIWNIASDNFPSAIQIVDLFHAKEHISDLIFAIISDPQEQRARREELYAILESGDVPKLVNSFGKLGATSGEQLDKVRIESNYFLQNRKRMQYRKFRAQGLFVGSGVIEAACKHVIGKRLKQSGMHWSVDGANRIAALRCSVLSGSFDYDLSPAA